MRSITIVKLDMFSRLIEMMNIKTHWLLALAIAPATLCLLGSLSLDWTHLNVRILLVLYWLAVLGSLVSLVSARRKRLIPIASTLASSALLWPASSSVLTWSAWWLNGFAP